MAIDPINNSNSLGSYQGSTTPLVSGRDHREKVEVVIQVPTKKTGIKGEEIAAQDSEQLKRAVECLNKKSGNSEALFGIHEETNRIIIRIVNKETKELIKELPPEKTLDMIAKAWEMAGLLVDEKR